MAILERGRRKMSNFKILTNDIIKRSALITNLDSTDSLYSKYNLLSNKKYHSVPTSIASGVYDQVANITLPVGQTATADFFCINLTEFKHDGLVAIRLRATNDTTFPVVWNTIIEIIPSNLVNLKGYYKNDYVVFFNTTSNFRIWDLSINNTMGGAIKLNKFYLGNSIDIGNPNEFTIRQSKESNVFTSDAGFSHFTKLKKDKKKYEVEFNLVSEANLAIMENFLLNNIEPLVWFYCSNPSFMDGVDLLSVNIIDFEIVKRTNQNEIYLECEEAI